MRFFNQTILTKNNGTVTGWDVYQCCPYGVVRYYVDGIGGGAHRDYVRRSDVEGVWVFE